MVSRDLAVPAVPSARSTARHLPATTSRQYRRAGYIEGEATPSVMEKARKTRADPPFGADVALSAIVSRAAQKGPIWRVAFSQMCYKRTLVADERMLLRRSYAVACMLTISATVSLVA
jgi:hypothetical protein